MNTYVKYFLKEFSRYFFTSLLIITAISIITEFFDKAPEFYREKPQFSLVIQYLLLQSPRVILFALPFASLFSILITIGVAEKWREIIAIKASGSSTKKIFSSFLVLGLIITIAAFLLGETVVPAATRKATFIRKVKILNESPRISHRKEALWIKGLDGSLIRISGFVEDQDKVLKTSIFSFSPSFTLDKRTEADNAEWTGDSWKLNNASIFDFNRNSHEKKESLLSNSLEEPKVFREEIKKPKEMNFTELNAYYSRLEKAGFKNVKYLVRLYEKLAYPTINFVMVLFGIALALNTRWGGGIKAAGLGVLISVVYWLLYSVCISLGNTGTLPPWVAPWIGPATFCLLGSFLYSSIKE